MKAENYIKINRASWDSRTAVHVDSDFYDNESFLKGKNTLNDIELKLLGDIKGKSILHLQCHFGQDSISLSRMGANVTGVDLSPKAIETAQNMAIQTNTDTQFICCDIYELPKHLDRQFDIVFTSYGVVGWLPDINLWAQIISKYLKPNGLFVFAEFHPVVWMFDDNFSKIDYSYFNTGAIIETESGTYAEKSADINNEYVCWNHSMSEVVQNLINNGINILRLEEYDYSPYNCFNETIEFEPNKFRIKSMGDKLPMVYSILGKKQEIVTTLQ